MLQKRFFLLFLCWLSVATYAAITTPMTYGVNTHPYDFLPIYDTPAPEGYTPFYISHYGRHGSRADQGYKYYPYLIQLLSEAHSQGALTPAGDSLLKLSQQINMLYADMPRRLLPLGLQQQARLAERMSQRYPEVFAIDSPRVRAMSSMVPRCLMSMSAFTNALTAQHPQIRYTMDCGEQYQAYINCRGKLNLTEQDTPPLIDSLTRTLSNGYDETLQYIFSNTHFLPDSALNRFMWALYSTLIYAPNFEVNCDPWMFISPQTMRYYDARITYHFYIDFCNSPYGYLRRPYAQLGLNDIIQKADSAIHQFTQSPLSADLRFGHDDPLLALVSAMELEGVGDKLEYNDILSQWLGYKYVPMAANVQLVFYRNQQGEVLVKALYNEQECYIHNLTPMDSYYYRWEDVRAKWLHTHRFATYTARSTNVLRDALDNHVDIIGMNDVTGNLQAGLSDYTCIAYKNENKGNSYQYIFYRTDRYECLHHYYSPSLHRCIVALMRVKRTGQQFYFCLAPAGWGTTAVDAYLAPLARDYTPLVLMGDPWNLYYLNMTPHQRQTYVDFQFQADPAYDPIQ